MGFSPWGCEELELSEHSTVRHMKEGTPTSSRSILRQALTFTVPWHLRGHLGSESPKPCTQVAQAEGSCCGLQLRSSRMEEILCSVSQEIQKQFFWGYNSPIQRYSLQGISLERQQKTHA